MNLFKRILIALAGGTVVLIGIALIPLPGPGLLVILAGLGILATEFAWARRWVVKLRSYLPRKKDAKPDAAIPAPLPLVPAKSPSPDA